VIKINIAFTIVLKGKLSTDPRIKDKKVQCRLPHDMCEIAVNMKVPIQARLLRVGVGIVLNHSSAIVKLGSETWPRSSYCK
jgi:hypothetical protein